MRRRLIVLFMCFACVVLLIGGLTLIWKHHHPKAAYALSYPVVSLSSVQVGDVPIVVTAMAILQANQATTITAKLSGYINSVSASEGTWVKQGEVLLSLEDTKEQQAYRSAQAEAALTKNTFERYAKLSKTGVISKQEFDQYQAKYAQAIAAATAAARALQETKLVAPFAGYLGPCSLSVGNFVTAGQALLTLTDSNALRVKYTLPSRYANRVHVGQPVRITQDYLPDAEFTAEVSFVAPAVDEATQTLEVHANLDNHAQQLKPGQAVTVAQTLGSANQVLLVPAAAVITDVNGSYVYRVDAQKVMQVPVTVGEVVDHRRIILAGLRPEESVITEGQFNVHPGQLVKVAAIPAR